MQWKWSEIHGEGKHVVMMGGLHTEMSVWSTFGEYLESSGGQLHSFKLEWHLQVQRKAILELHTPNKD